MTGRELHFIVPGSLEQRTGGYIYDARIVAGLRGRGWAVRVHDLGDESQPGDRTAHGSLARVLGELPDGAWVVIDGLAMGGSPDVVRAHRLRLQVLALVHLRLADETGLAPTEHDRLLVSESAALAASAGVIATSPTTAARVQEMGIDPARIRTVTPGTDPAPLATGPGDALPPQLLCVASVTPRKGQDVLVRALGRLAEIPWSCVLAGSLTRSAAFADGLQSQVHDLGLADRIALPGECDEATVDSLYQTSSVFVLPSHDEGFGMVLTEAMARGLPVVTTRAGAIPETVPPDAGILVPPGDETGLADALRRLLLDAADGPGSALARRRRMGSAGREYAASLPDWVAATEAFADAVLALSDVEP